MSGTSIPIPVKKRRGIMRRSIIPGAATALILLGALELGLQVIANGHPDPAVKLYALAFSVTAGAIVAGMRGSGGAGLVLLAVTAASSSQGADRSRVYPVTIATAACPTGTPGVLADGKEAGLALAGLRFWSLTVCPATGDTVGGTISGAGKLHACVFRRSPGPNAWTLSPTFYWDMADDGSGTAITSTSSNRCVTFSDIQLGMSDGDLLYVYPSADFGVSGATGVKVFLEGVL